MQKEDFKKSNGRQNERRRVENYNGIEDAKKNNMRNIEELDRTRVEE